MQMTLARGQMSDSLFAGDWSWLIMVARLAPGAAGDDARAQLAVAARQRDALFPGRRTRVVVTRGALLNFPEARDRGAFAIALFGVLGALVVVMICANLMNLLLARGIARRREIGIRLAVGASRRRLVEQLLAESGLLALIGGSLGFALAFLLPTLVPKILPVPMQFNLAPDGRVLGFTVLVSFATAIVFGLLPAWRATRVDLVSALKGGASQVGRGVHRSRLRGTIVGVQVAGSAFLLVVAALLVRAARHGSAIDLGYTTAGVATFELNFRMLGYSAERARATFDALVRRLEATPGVQAVSLASPLPLLGRRSGMLRDADTPGAEQINASMVSSTGSHFATLEIPLVAGRAFTDAETAAAGVAGEQPVVVSQSLARRLAADGSPLGKRLIMDGTNLRVVGVAADAHVTALGAPEVPFIYLPAHPGRDQDLFLLVRASGSLAPVERLVPQLAAAVDPSIVVKTQRLSQRLALELTPARISSAIAGTMGALTLLLALVGIYGVVSFAVAQRTRDIAVRRALGANDGSVVRLMMRQGSWSVIIGLAVGAAIAIVASQALRGLLLGVSPLDAMSFGAAIGALLLTATVATWVPARRASRVDPARILRED
jgi:predicted permease